MPETGPLITAQTAISYLIASGGNAALAAVRASKELTNQPDSISEAQLLATIAEDPSSLTTLTTQVRLLAILQAVNAFQLTHRAYIQHIPNLSAKDTARTYTDLLAQISDLGKGAPLTATDPYEAILRSLPPEVSTAVSRLLQAPHDPADTTPTHDDALTINPPSVAEWPGASLESSERGPTATRPVTTQEHPSPAGTYDAKPPDQPAAWLENVITP